MKHNMKKLAAGLLFLLLSVSLAHAQVVRVRGTIDAFDGSTLALTTRGEGKALQLHLAPDAGVATAKAITLADLPPNAYVGVTSLDKEGRKVALEVHVLPPTAAPGQTPWDLEPGSTMTNANLEGYARVDGGNEITLRFKDTSQKVLVPEGAPIGTSLPGSKADLKPGEYVVAFARKDADGKLTALRIQVSKDGFRPPL